MEQHAVPQDITGFQFKLVGDMTLKQFGELAFGLIMAYLFFISNWHPVLKYPLAVFFAVLGAALAFMPIEERPLDIWIINFFRSIYKPTYYVWKKGAVTGMDNPPLVAKGPVQVANFEEKTVPQVSAPQLATITTTPPPPPLPQPWPFKEEEKEKKDEKTPPPMSLEEFMNQKEEQVKNSPAGMTVEDLLKKRQEMTAAKEVSASGVTAEKEKTLGELVEKNKQMLLRMDEIRNTMFAATPGTDNAALQKELDDMAVEKNKLAAEITKARDEMTTAKVATLSNPIYKEPVVVHKVPATPKVTPTLSLTEIPNVINGMVADANGTPLEAVILIVKDDQGNSIRALRTNKVGQFIASTPLVNGKYILELEKVGQQFEAFEVTLEGTVLQPLHIKAMAAQQQ